MSIRKMSGKVQLRIVTKTLCSVAGCTEPRQKTVAYCKHHWSVRQKVYRSMRDSAFATEIHRQMMIERGGQ